MCGIVGFATAFKNGFISSEMDAFYNMLYFDALRGMDSTGVFGVDNVGNVQVHKEATNALAFMAAKELHSFKAEAISSGKIVVGHNRAATRGVVKDENAHPFIIEDRIVLVQNGTWVGSHKSVKDTEVDTEALAHLIYENADDIPKAFEKINAAYALCWYDVAKKSVYLARNKDRPLFLGVTKGGAYAWCSEPGFLRVALARNNIELESITLVPEQKLITLSLEDRDLVRKPDVDLPSFRYPISTKPAQWPHVPDEDIDPVGARREVLTPINIKKPGHVLMDDWVQFDFYTIATRRLEEKIVPAAEADEILLRLGELVSTKQPVELVDYAAANVSPTCKTWHVYGSLILPDDNDILHNVAVHWFMYNKTEQEIMDYVAHAFYSVTLNAMRKHTVNGHQRLVTSIVTSPIPFAALNLNALQ
jgi:Glutamine amidotransferase domain